MIATDLPTNVRNAYIILIAKPEERAHLVRPGHRWDANIKMVFKEILLEDVTVFIFFRVMIGGGQLLTGFC